MYLQQICRECFVTYIKVHCMYFWLVCTGQGLNASKLLGFVSDIHGSAINAYIYIYIKKIIFIVYDARDKGRTILCVSYAKSCVIKITYSIYMCIYI